MNIAAADLSDIIPENDTVESLKATSVVSMGTDISDEDLLNIRELCDQVRARAREGGAWLGWCLCLFVRECARAHARARGGGWAELTARLRPRAGRVHDGVPRAALRVRCARARALAVECDAGGGLGT